MKKNLGLRTWLTISVVLSLSIIFSPGIHFVHGVCEAGPADFRPYGPQIERVQIRVSGAKILEGASFGAGGLDLVDLTAAPACPGPADVRQSIPVGGVAYSVLNCWAGAITRQTAAVGYNDYWSGQIGFTNIFTILNMRQVLPPVCVPGAGFTPGGGDQELLRWGLQPGTGFLSVFTASTDPELRILRTVYDTLLEANPNNPNQLLDWMTTSHRMTTMGPNTVLVFHLRNDVRWQDGFPVTPSDACQSLLAYQDVPHSFTFGSTTIPLILNCAKLSATVFQVTVAGVCLPPGCIDYERDIGGLPIIPLHIWDTNFDGVICSTKVIGPCNGLNADATTAPGYDPMLAGTFIGSGAFECLIPPGFPGPGTLGGPCTVSGGALAGMALGNGDTLTLTRYDNYMRGPADLQGSSYQTVSWADKNNDGAVNILDIADIAFQFGKADPYWVNPLISPGPVVNIVHVATAAFYFDHGTTSPFAPAALTGLDPTLDLFIVGPDYYQQCVVAGGGGAVTCNLDGLVAPAGVSVTDDFGAVITGPCAPAVPVVAGQTAFTCALAPAAIGEIHVTITVAGAVITVQVP